MARVTVEDCLTYCENRFDLVLKAAARAHRLELGQAEAKVPEDNDKPTVVALREIAGGHDVNRDEQEERRRQEENQLVERFLGAPPAAPAPMYQDDIDAQEAEAYTSDTASVVDGLIGTQYIQEEKAASSDDEAASSEDEQVEDQVEDQSEDQSKEDSDSDKGSADA